MKVLTELRPSPIAGLWYSGDPQTLSAQIDGYLAAAHPPEHPGEIVAVIAPHAGYRYSGPVAGYAFRAIAGRSCERVVVISPMHQPYPHPVLTTAHRGYETPLGVVEIDQAALTRLDEELQAGIGLPVAPIAHDSEHSLEIELPFLQRALVGEFKLVPVMLREQSASITQGFAHALVRTLRSYPALLVASTDLSHFYPESQAKIFDRETLRQIEAFSPEGLYRAAQMGEAQACGLNAVATVLWAAREMGADYVEVLHYATSGDASGDHSSVVGYGAAVVIKRS